MAWVQIMEDILATRPSPHPACLAEDGQQPVQVQESLASEVDTFDFERYLYVLPLITIIAR